jgi:hypothetical protein
MFQISTKTCLKWNLIGSEKIKLTIYNPFFVEYDLYDKYPNINILGLGVIMDGSGHIILLLF